MDDTSPIARPRRRRGIPASTTPAAPSCLYPDEKEVGILILGPDRAKYWRGLAIVLERDGFPKVDPEFGGRYWPAVCSFLDERHAVRERDVLRRGRW